MRSKPSDWQWPATKWQTAACKPSDRQNDLPNDLATNLATNSDSLTDRATYCAANRATISYLQADSATPLATDSDWPTGQPTAQPTERPTELPTDRETDRHREWLTDCATDQATNQLIYQPTVQLPNWPTVTDRAIDWAANHCNRKSDLNARSTDRATDSDWLTDRASRLRSQLSNWKSDWMSAVESVKWGLGSERSDEIWLTRDGVWRRKVLLR